MALLRNCRVKNIVLITVIVNLLLVWLLYQVSPSRFVYSFLGLEEDNSTGRAPVIVAEDKTKQVSSQTGNDSNDHLIHLTPKEPYSTERAPVIVAGDKTKQVSSQTGNDSNDHLIHLTHKEPYSTERAPVIVAGDKTKQVSSQTGNDSNDHLIHLTPKEPYSTERAPVIVAGDKTKQVSSQTGNESNDHWIHLTPKEAYDRFVPMTSSKCANVCGNFKPEECKANSSDAWAKLMGKGVVRGVPLYQENEFLFPFEKFYYNFPSLTDTKLLPDLDKSIIYLVNENGETEKAKDVTCNHMDSLTFRVDLVDSYGFPRKHGGDEVRVKIRGNPTAKGKLDFSSAGYVRDLTNGSYLATIKCSWAGYAELRVAMTYPREYLRAALDNSRLGVYVFVAGDFVKGGVSETTICHAHPNIPGRPCLCNLTSWNSLPFFCGRPLDPRLTCDTYQATDILRRQPRLTMTEAESTISKTMGRFASSSSLSQPVHISIVNEDMKKLPQVPCHETNKSLTWDFQPSQGYWSNGSKWTSFICKEPEATPSWLQDCLKDSFVWLIGDSNLRFTFEALQKAIEAGENPKWYYGVKFYMNPRKAIRLTFQNHEFPFYTHYRKWKPKLVGVSRLLNNVPSTGRHFICIHYFLHQSRSHLSSIFIRLTELRKSIIRLLHRNPVVNIALRGPHITINGVPKNSILGGDTLGAFYRAFYLEIFRDLRDKVLFLDGWDLTIASGNLGYHTDAVHHMQLMRTFFSFKCP